MRLGVLLMLLGCETPATVMMDAAFDRVVAVDGMEQDAGAIDAWIRDVAPADSTSPDAAPICIGDEPPNNVGCTVGGWAPDNGCCEALDVLPVYCRMQRTPDGTRIVPTCCRTSGIQCTDAEQCCGDNLRRTGFCVPQNTIRVCRTYCELYPSTQGCP